MTSGPPAARTVVIGDLNAAADALWDILRGTRLVDADARWTGGDAELIQLGDLFNRGPGAREALELLLSLKRQAARAGGRVTLLLGNHEVMTALRNEAYCTEAEYLAFAPAAAQRAWPARVHRAMRALYRAHPPRGPIPPLAPRLEQWKVEHVPGRAEMRRALGPRGRLGRALRAMPVVAQRGATVFVHAGLRPRWARLGVAGLNRAAREAWAAAPAFFDRLPRTGIFRAPTGPLWDRAYCGDADARAELELARALAMLSARRMVIGHTATPHVPGGRRGHILVRFDGRLVCADVGLASGPGGPRTALLIEGGVGLEWTPHGTRPLWRDADGATTGAR